MPISEATVSLDHKICDAKQGCRKLKAECPCGLEVEGQLEAGKLVERNVAGIGALENLTYLVREGASPESIPTQKAVAKSGQDGPLPRGSVAHARFGARLSDTPARHAALARAYSEAATWVPSLLCFF